MSDQTREEELIGHLNAQRQEIRDVNKECMDLRAQLAACESRRDNLELRIKSVDAEHADMERQKHKSIEAFQKLEQQLAVVTKERDHLDAIVNSMDPIIPQLLTDLKAAQAEVKRLNDWKRIVEGSGTDHETIIRMKADDYTRTAVQCWKDKVQHLESRTARLVVILEKICDTWRHKYNDLESRTARYREALSALVIQVTETEELHDFIYNRGAHSKFVCEAVVKAQQALAEDAISSDNRLSDPPASDQSTDL